VAALVVACATAQPALADPMPAGTYDVRMLSGSIQAGTFLPAVALPAVGPVAVQIGTDAVTQPLGDIAVQPSPFSVPVSGSTVSGTLTPTVKSASVTLDPATGAGSVDLALYASATINVSGVVSSSGTCTLASADQPVVLHLTTASGVPWSATTGNFSLKDDTFAVPAPSCSNGTLGALFSLVVGNTGAGNNVATIIGNAKRQPDPAPAPTLAQETTSTGGSSTPLATQPSQPGSTTSPTTNTRAPTVRRCVVPNVKGRSLSRARRALTRAGCRVGRVRINRRSRSRAGVVLTQARRPGARVPVGTAVAITVAGRRSR
jgi:hypothetical protein